MAKVNGPGSDAQHTHGGTEGPAPVAMTPLPVSAAEPEATMASKAATVAIIGLGVALIEAELIPGMIIGAAAILAPDLLPKIGRGLRPFLN